MQTSKERIAGAVVGDRSDPSESSGRERKRGETGQGSSSSGPEEAFNESFSDLEAYSRAMQEWIGWHGQYIFLRDASLNAQLQAISLSLVADESTIPPMPVARPPPIWPRDGDE